MRIECKINELAALLDAKWEEERQDPTCPECDGTNLNEDGTRCWDCDPEVGA